MAPLLQKGYEEAAALERRGTSAHGTETLCASVLSAVQWGQDRTGHYNLERPLHRAARTTCPGVGAAKDASVTAPRHAGLRAGAWRPVIRGKSSCPSRTGIAQKEEQACPENWPGQERLKAGKGPPWLLNQALGKLTSACGHTVALATAPEM